MSEGSDYSPRRDYDFSSARKTYTDNVVSRSYDKAVKEKVNKKDLVPARISSDATSIFVFLFDVTGSMGTRPATIFSKLPYFEHEARNYLGNDLAFCVGAIGNAYSDQYPLQIQPFVTDFDALKESLEKLIIEGNGGGQLKETYELGALYACRNIDIPNAVKPILIFSGDEAPYLSVSVSFARDIAKVDLEMDITTAEIFAELKRKFSVYFIANPYDSNDGDQIGPRSEKIYQQWVNLLGEDHVIFLTDPYRIADVCFGILAKEVDRLEEFHAEITDRQDADQVKIVYEALKDVMFKPIDVSKKADGQEYLSTPFKDTTGKKAKKLMQKE